MNNETKLYGLAEGMLGRHTINKETKLVLRMLPKEVRNKCTIEGNKITGFRACDG
jgi:hypothetical protein